MQDLVFLWRPAIAGLWYQGTAYSVLYNSQLPPSVQTEWDPLNSAMVRKSLVWGWATYVHMRCISDVSFDSTLNRKRL